MSHHTEQRSKEKLILEKYAFFVCDPIDLKQSMEGTLKV